MHITMVVKGCSPQLMQPKTRERRRNCMCPAATHGFPIVTFRVILICCQCNWVFDPRRGAPAWDVALAKSRSIGGGHDLLDHASRAHPRAEAAGSPRR